MPGPSIAKPQRWWRKRPPTWTSTVFPRWPPAGKMYRASGDWPRSAVTVSSSVLSARRLRRMRDSLTLEQFIDDLAVVHDFDRPALGRVELVVRIDAEQMEQ